MNREDISIQLLSYLAHRYMHIPVQPIHIKYTLTDLGITVEVIYNEGRNTQISFFNNKTISAVYDELCSLLKRSTLEKIQFFLQGIEKDKLS